MVWLRRTGTLICLEARTGRLLWKVRAPRPRNGSWRRGEMISRWPVRTGVLVDRGIAYFGAGIFPHETSIFCCDCGRKLPVDGKCYGASQ